LDQLFQLIAERASVEPRIDVDFKAKVEHLEEKFEVAYQEIIVRFATEKETMERIAEDARKRIIAWYESERDVAEKEFTETRNQFIDRYANEKAAAKAEFQETRWTITAVYEGSKATAEKQLQEGEHLVADAVQRIQSIERETREFLRACRQAGELDRETKPQNLPAGDKEPLAQLRELLAFADWKLLELKALTLPKFFKGERLLWALTGLWLLSIYPAAWLTNWNWVISLAGSLVLIAVIGASVSAWLYALARSQVRRFYEPLDQALRAAKALLKHCEDRVKFTYHRNLGEAKKRYNKDVRQATAKCRQETAESRQRRTAGLQQVASRYRERRAEIKERRAREWSEAATNYRRTRAQNQKRFESQSRKVQAQRERRLTDLQTRHEQDWATLVNNWQQGLARIEAEIRDIREESSRLFPDWNQLAWNTWAPASAVPPVIRFGEFQVSLDQIPNGEPRHQRLRSREPIRYSLPAFLSFPDPCSLLVRASDEGRGRAVQALQAVMFRLLTANPPGKVRFTIIDPVGLGRNFASFMHLADHDEALVTSRIWTEVPHIEQRLADLTGHMENVIQKYLRNQFESIEEYNLHAGEVAEPYRILVVANFPFNFSTEAIRRLVSIVSSGPRCGVHTLISVDVNQPLPQGFALSDLEQPGVTLLWEDQRFTWQDDDFGNFPLELDAPPPEALCTNVLQTVGDKAREAKRVEVPFEFVAPPPEQWWAGDSRSGINVPLGRVGATKRQHLRLGHGTSQHVLVAGKTGSGKSTLLHALISNLSLAYSPDEVELYLVDFKKGVEFKTYANHELPHARVVAVESEREFGLSVLQRLDGELKLRGERFRAVGAQDIRAYREDQGGAARLPRILLIVDEFQEFFVEDDKLAQDAALLLDRLVRQGRAFGLHVLLGSQTLGGAYTLARSTIDQMAVRIALQCSEADGHLILSEDNSAARLLSRPGEAIYNDANGLVEGNNPFQVVWLPDDRREDYLQKIQELARQRYPGVNQPQIVFEGNAPADVTKNVAVSELLHAPSWPAPTRSARAWLGEAIAIKDPTVAVFRSQSSSNLLIVGQQDEAALGIMATALVSLAVHYNPTLADSKDGARFYVLDGTPDDVSYTGFLSRVTGALPHSVRLAAWRELTAVFTELADELDRRQKSTKAEDPAIYLFIYGLQRFRDLRRQEDDFGFSRSPEERPNPAKQFDSLVREGPSVGIHTIVWCDNLNNVTRSLERSALREFDMRVIFQMGNTDSSNLIDSPLASKLGLHRAYFHSEEQGRLEKFRPYGLPADAWLDWVKQRLESKTT
jgi:hypothetical protein